MSNRRRRRSLTVASVAVYSLATSPVTAQSSTAGDPSAGQHFTALSVNALLGGVSAGFFRLARGESFLEGFLGGAAGGSVSYAGKVIAARPFDGAGLLGRQLASVGHSVQYNASGTHSILHTLIVPLGPLPIRLQLTTEDRLTVQPKIDLISTGAVVYGLLDPQQRFDLAASLSAGAAVFVRPAPVRRPGSIVIGPDARESEATTFGGAIFVRDQSDMERVLAHERVHVLQFDFVNAAWGDRLDTAMFSRAPTFDRWVKVNFLAMVFGTASQALVFPRDRQGLPWEREARMLAGQ